MIKLTDQMRAEIINVLVEEASYRESIDMQRFLMRGVTELEIGLIDTVIRLLRESPYLSDVDLGQQLARAMTFKCGTSLLLPKDPMEIAAYIILSRFGRYRSMTYDFDTTIQRYNDTTILTAKNEHNSIEIEVKVFSSQLTLTTPLAVCLIDDIPEFDYVSRSSTKILHLHDFSMRHENGANRELLKAMNF